MHSQAVVHNPADPMYCALKTTIRLTKGPKGYRRVNDGGGDIDDGDPDYEIEGDEAPWSWEVET